MFSPRDLCNRAFDLLCFSMCASHYQSYPLLWEYLFIKIVINLVREKMQPPEYVKSEELSEFLQDWEKQLDKNFQRIQRIHKWFLRLFLIIGFVGILILYYRILSGF